MKRSLKRDAVVSETGFGPAIAISLIKGPKPYLYVETVENSTAYGYIKDRDVKRLKEWCEAILDKRVGKGEG